MLRAFLSCIFLLALTACGFHLRGVGAGALPFSSIEITGDGAFANDLRTYLRRDGNIKVVSGGTADVRIDVRSERYQKDILSLNNVGRAAEYRLNYQIDYQAVKGDQIILERGKHDLHRTLTWDTNNVLSKENEEAVLQKDMRQDAIQLVLLRVIAALRQAQ